ncbi:MAG: DUF5654 family protein [archaeon]
MKRASENTNGEIIAGLKAKLATLEMEIKNDVSVPIVASFGFLVALVWRDAIKAAIDEFLLRSGLLERAYFYNFISAIIVTIIVITIMIVITRFSRSRKKKKLKNV